MKKHETMGIALAGLAIVGLYQLCHMENDGGTEFVLASVRDSRYLRLTMVPLIALVFAVWYMEKHLNDHGTLLLSMILIISGGIGNLIDRVWLGYVTDLFDFCLINFPVFNIADIAICVGCFFLVVFIFFFDKEQQGEHANEQ